MSGRSVYYNIPCETTSKLRASGFPVLNHGVPKNTHCNNGQQEGCFSQNRRQNSPCFRTGALGRLRLEERSLKVARIMPRYSV